MKDEFIKFLEQLDKINLSDSPGFKLFRALASNGNARYPEQAVIASLIKIEINQNFTDSKDLFNKAVEVYVNALNKIWDSLAVYELEDRKTIMKNFASKMSIQYSF